MEDNQTTGILLNEEALTALNLQALYKAHSNEVTVLDFTRAEESSTSGADWEWWFLGKKCFGCVVQAKRLEESRYEIGYVPKNNYPQIDRLLDYAIDVGVEPLYCFYNWWHFSKNPSPWNCGSYAKKDSLQGCTVADGWGIYQQHLSGIYDANSISRIAEPWHCIVCCEVRGKDPAERAKNIVGNLRLGSGRDLEKVTFKEKRVPEIKLHDTLPPHVLRAYKFAIEGKSAEAAEAMGKGPKRLVFVGDINKHLDRRITK